MAKKRVAKKKTAAVTEPERDRIESAIVELRGERVILDTDLATVYGVETRQLNQQVKRNVERFGEKYTFQLTKGEFDSLRSQSVISKTGRGGRRYPPWAITEIRAQAK